jgi:cytochrome c peroxidase
MIMRRLFLLSITLMSAALVYAATMSAAELQSLSKGLFGVVKPVDPKEVTTPQAVLGRALFWDERLSVNGKVACASCHSAANWSASNKPTDLNAKGIPTTLHSQPIFMSVDQVSLGGTAIVHPAPIKPNAL